MTVRLEEGLIYEILSLVEAGRLAPHFPEQRQRLLQEGVVFRHNGCVDMDACQWRC